MILAERTRFVHIVENSEINDEFRVGCICAEKMTSDYVNPKRMENDLRNKATRRSNWINKEWKISRSEHHLLIYRDKLTKKYKGSIDKTWGRKTYDTLRHVKAAPFNGIEYSKSRGYW